LSDYDGSWRYRSYQDLLFQIKNALRIKTTDNLKALTIDKVFDVIWWMSYKKIGSMIVVTSKTNIDKMKSKSEAGKLINQSFDALVPDSIFDLGMLDGAILMDDEGWVYYAGLQFTYLIPLPDPLNTIVERKGTRHHQAAYIATEESDTTVFTVSENRGIGAFYDKKAIYFDK